MPRFPYFAQRIHRIQPSVFEKFRSKMKEKRAFLIHMHIGDTYLPPDYPLPIDQEFLKSKPYFNRYCNTFGIESFRRALVKKVNEDNGFKVDTENILATSGATDALSASVLSLLNPGEEILVLTPCWPFFLGMVELADARVVQVPFYVRLYHEPELDIITYLENHLTSTSAALYLNTPNNPSGKVLNLYQLLQVAEFARKHKLWIISDEAYDGLIFDNHQKHCIATLPGMFEQTLSIFTFSKSFMFAGLRLGYLVAAELVVKEINKTMVHQLYSPSTLSQYMMIEPVKNRQNWIPKLREHYQELRDRFLQQLEIPVQPPEGTYFLFFSIRNYLNGRTYWQVIDELLEAGVAVAAGEDFGKDYGDHIRICFTGERPERVQLAIERINKVLLKENGR
jgi:aspartate/methionine/tyrosine aminotransferase